jgi:thermostable 8-oxoguanine DNA glycosylase
MSIVPDPQNFTNFNRTQVELEAMLLFSIMVAGKRATVAAQKLGQFLSMAPAIKSPFEVVMHLDRAGILLKCLKIAGVGQYRRIETAFREVVKIDPAFCTLDEMGSVRGIGPKTARMFLMHSRPDQQFAALDTHVLHFMRDAFGFHAGRIIPRTTPSGGRFYRDLENLFLHTAYRLKMTPAALDLTIWRHYSKNKGAKR